jgi:hypothetical protein
MMTWTSRRLSNCQPMRSSSRSRPLKLSIHAFYHGLPGSMNTVFVPLNRHRSATDGQREANHHDKQAPAHKPDQITRA